MNFTIRDAPIYERPRERLAALGPGSLSLQELIQIILSQGSRKGSVVYVAQALVKKYATLHGLHQASVIDLCQIPGIGYAKAIQIKAALELGIRLQNELDLPKSSEIVNSKEAYKVARSYLEHKIKEQVMLFNLDVHGRLINTPEILSVGILDSSLIHPREIFNAAISNHAAKIILAHNHPSGDSSPSVQDIEITGQIFEAGMILGIPLVDHLVIGNNEYNSIRELEPELFKGIEAIE